MERKCETNGKQRGRVKKRRKREKEEMEENRGKWKKRGKCNEQREGRDVGPDIRCPGPRANSPGFQYSFSNITGVNIIGWY